MKVLIIPSWYPNKQNHLVGSFFKEQAELLSNNGYEVKILMGNNATIYENIHLKNQLANFFHKHTISLDTEYLEQNPPALSFSLFLNKSWNEREIYEKMRHGYSKAFSKLILSGWKPDIIHAQCTVDGGIMAHFLSTEFKIPYVIIEHQIFLLSMYSEYKQKLLKNALQNATKVGAVSYHQKRCILMHAIKCNTTVTWNFCNEELFRFIPSTKKEKFRILTISYSSYIKDIETFFKSIADFRHIYKDNDFEVVIIGNNSFKDLQKADTAAFESLAKKYNIHSKCIFIPFLQRKEIVEILNTADVFISTSIAETFGLAVREALLCGVPVITTASGGVEDTINEKTGFKVNIEDHGAIAEALLKIKKKEVTFDSEYLRNHVISQCGKFAFLEQMKNFYSIK